MGPGRNVGTLVQTLAGHADTIGLVAPASRGLSCQRGPAFTTGVYVRINRLCWYYHVSRRQRPLLLHPFPPLNLDGLSCRNFLAIFVFDSLYF